jgi:murein tripeptide amidase MpaA/uncharacterized membrane protein
MIIILCLGSFGSLSAAPAQASQGETPNNAYVVARIYFDSRAELENLTARLDVWEVNQKEGYLVAMVTEQHLEMLAQAGFRVEIDQAKTDQIHQPLVPLLGQGPDSIPGYPCYRTVEETYADLQDLAVEYPDLIELMDIGDSWEKDQNPDAGYDIWAMRMTNENIPGPKPTFFLMAEIHAREYPTAEMAMRFIEYLLAGYETNADIHWLLDYYEIHVVPMVNPDGRKEAEGGQWWRKNTDNDDGCNSYPSYGTDLNRNYGFHWVGGGSSTYPCDETYRGPEENSEPETLAIENYVVTLFEDQRGPLDTDPAPITTTGSLITLHTYGELVLWPWGWTATDAPNHTQLQTLGRKYAFYNDHNPQQSNDLYPTNGTTDDWTYGQLGIASYTFEMGNDFFQDCDTFQNSIYPKNRQALVYAFKATRQPYIDPKGPESLYLSALPEDIHPGQAVNLTATASDERYGGSGEPTQNIAGARYSIDQPSWIEGSVTYPMEASDGSFNSKSEGVKATIDTSQLSAGRHTLFVESMDADGNWGVPSAIFMTVAAELTPDTVQAEGMLGEVVTYTLEYTNGLDTAADFKVTVSSDWTASAPTSLGTLGSLESATFDVVVTVPITATDGQSDEAIVKVSKIGDIDIYDTSQLLTIASSRGVVITPTNVTTFTLPGVNIIYPMSVANRGAVSDTFDLVFSSGWPAILSAVSIGPLDPGEEFPLVLTVTVPVTATPGDADMVVITATSQSDPEKFAVATRTTIVQIEYGLSVNALDDSLRAPAPATPVTYTIFVTNTGSLTDTYNLVISSTWPLSYSTPIGPLAPGESTTIYVVVNVPPEAVNGEQDIAILRFTSQANPLIFKELDLTTMLVWYNLYLPITTKQ